MRIIMNEEETVKYEGLLKARKSPEKAIRMILSGTSFLEITKAEDAVYSIIWGIGDFEANISETAIPVWEKLSKKEKVGLIREFKYGLTDGLTEEGNVILSETADKFLEKAFYQKVVKELNDTPEDAKACIQKYGLKEVFGVYRFPGLSFCRVVKWAPEESLWVLLEYE